MQCSASEHLNISTSERQTIMNSKDSLLFSEGQSWEKRTSTSIFDVTMGSYDGAETCKLVGCYLLSQLNQLPGIEIGLYRDNRLAVLNQTPLEIDRANKERCQIFARNNLKIPNRSKEEVVNFLDVTLDLNTGKFKPFTKPLSTPLYVHSQSNHPPNIIRNIPAVINRRILTTVPRSIEKEWIHAQARIQASTTRRRFNLPYNKNVKTSIGRAFISLINSSFPADHKLRKIFNRNTLKLSYGCIPKRHAIDRWLQQSHVEERRNSTATTRRTKKVQL